MKLMIIRRFTDRQKSLIKKAGIEIEDREYDLDELLHMDDVLLKDLNSDCIDENDDVTEEGCEYEDIIDKLVDLEYEANPSYTDELLSGYVEENSHVELNNGRRGVVADISNEAYTIEIDDEYKKGNVEDDICIVPLNAIRGIIPDYEVNINQDWNDDEE